MANDVGAVAAAAAAALFALPLALLLDFSWNGSLFNTCSLLLLMSVASLMGFSAMDEAEEEEEEDRRFVISLLLLISSDRLGCRARLGEGLGDTR